MAGRVSIAAGGIFASKIALNIAVRYAYHRKQFGEPTGTRHLQTFLGSSS